MKLALVMLAAGNSRRFGSNKLLYCVDGKEMYLHTLEQLLLTKETLESKRMHADTNPSDVFHNTYICEITLVTQYEEIARTAEKMGVKVRFNLHPEEGISSSLKIGLQANMDADACIFTVSDQPWLTADTIVGLIQGVQKSGKGMGCLSAFGKTGNPCVFFKKYYPELLMLEGDTGGKKVLRAHPEDIFFCPVYDSRELEDVDYVQG